MRKNSCLTSLRSMGSLVIHQTVCSLVVRLVHSPAQVEEHGDHPANGPLRQLPSGRRCLHVLQLANQDPQVFLMSLWSSGQSNHRKIQPLRCFHLRAMAGLGSWWRAKSVVGHMPCL